MFRLTWTRNLLLGTAGEDVRCVQQLLKKAGYDPGPIDGVFGNRTDAATRDFQRARSLKVDGVVGPITFAALTGAPAPSGGPPRGKSLHIGLNTVDNDAYGMPVPVLRGCVNDANDMATLARAQGFGPSVLLDSQATAASITATIGNAAEELSTGDFFLLTYSGHGSQLRDLSTDEADKLDETWVAYDRQLLDDELYSLLGRFKPGVRVAVLSDSCHSGTVTRDVVFAYGAFASSYQDSREVGFVLETPMDVGAQATRDLAGGQMLRDAVRQVMPSVVSQLYGRTRTAMVDPDVDRHVDMVLGHMRGDVRGQVLSGTPITRNLPAEIAYQDGARRRDVYQQAKLATRSAVPPRAKVLLISGCQDNQLSLDGSRNGLFTQRLLEVWNNGYFTGIGYPDLHRQIMAVMPPQQTPNLYWATPPDPAFEQQRPFTI